MVDQQKVLGVLPLQPSAGFLAGAALTGSRQTLVEALFKLPYALMAAFAVSAWLAACISFRCYCNFYTRHDESSSVQVLQAE